MDIAKVTSKGQITIPKAVRDNLDLEPGSKVVFIQLGRDLVIRNADKIETGAPRDAGHVPGFFRMTEKSLPAFRRLQEAFKGFAEEEGLQTEEDVVEWVKKLDRDSEE
jgi:AbrB family looped-hinge helix DNA binding protein